MCWGGGGGGGADDKIKIDFKSLLATFLQGQINRIDCLMSAVESTVEIIRDWAPKDILRHHGDSAEFPAKILMSETLPRFHITSQLLRGILLGIRSRGFFAGKAGDLGKGGILVRIYHHVHSTH